MNDILCAVLDRADALRWLLFAAAVWAFYRFVNSEDNELEWWHFISRNIIKIDFARSSPEGCVSGGLSVSAATIGGSGHTWFTLTEGCPVDAQPAVITLENSKAFRQFVTFRIGLILLGLNLLLLEPLFGSSV